MWSAGRRSCSRVNYYNGRHGDGSIIEVGCRLRFCFSSSSASSSGCSSSRAHVRARARARTRYVEVSSKMEHCPSLSYPVPTAHRQQGQEQVQQQVKQHVQQQLQHQERQGRPVAVVVSSTTKRNSDIVNNSCGKKHYYDYESKPKGIRFLSAFPFNCLTSLSSASSMDESSTSVTRTTDGNIDSIVQNSGSQYRVLTVAGHQMRLVQQKKPKRHKHHQILQQPYHFSVYQFSSSTAKDSTSSDNQKEDEEDENATAGTNTNSNVQRRKRQPYEKQMIVDPDRQLYQDIRRRQQQLREEARERTAKNVQRALIGNVIICCAKLSAWLSSGSSSMMSEFVHSVVDCGNQGLLLMGLRDSQKVSDGRHQYGYGKSVYFWALVSALGTFFMGAGVSCTHAVGELFHPSIQEVIGWEVWFVLSMSFVIDGYVLVKTIREISIDQKDSNVSFYTYVKNMRDPATLAVLLEDGAACAGVVIAIAGISSTFYTGMPIFDGLAGVSISALLASMGLILVKMNHRFLLGQAVDQDIIDDIRKILMSRRSIETIQSVQSQWTGPETFSYKAEIDFDGTFLAAKLLPRYQHEFIQIQNADSTSDKNDALMKSELRLLLSWYAEDVIRTVEREVRHIEALVRKKYPGAEYIELEPMSKFSDMYAIDDGEQDDARRNETETLFRFLKALNVKLGMDSMTGVAPSNMDNIDGDASNTAGTTEMMDTKLSNSPDDYDELSSPRSSPSASSSEDGKKR